MATLRQTIEAIKSLKIQGAQEVAEAALLAWAKAKNKNLATKLLKNVRPTEPMLFNALDAVNLGISPYRLIKKFEEDRKKIVEIGANLIKNNQTIFTHCHSSTVTEILKFAKAMKKNIHVHNTETRPLFQGRKTAEELAAAGISVCFWIDSAAFQALKEADIFLIGADWISNEGVANKIGSASFVELANFLKIPIYICAHSWKYSPKKIIIEERNPKEVWPNAPKGIHIHNPAFEIIDFKFIKGIVCEFGILKPKEFLKKTNKNKYGRL